MGASAPSQSGSIIRPKTLNERLAAETPAPEAMAERFAPGAWRGRNGLFGRPMIERQRVLGLGVPPARGSNPAVLVAALIISLIPTAIILGLLRFPIEESMVSKSETTPFVETDKASIAAPSPVETEVRPEIALTTDRRIEGLAGQDVPFKIAIDRTDIIPSRSIIAIRAIPEGATFSQGRPYGSSEWSLSPKEIGDLRIHLPENTASGSDMRIELMDADGTVLASATTRLDVTEKGTDIAQNPSATLILRSDESDRIDDLIKHGQKMIDVGYLAGARAYFKRAAEAGSGEAALLLGACYDATFIKKIGARGIKPDPQEARNWYERAKKLGIADADAKLDALAGHWLDHQNAPPPPAGAAGRDNPIAQSARPEPIVSADSSSSDTDEWIELSSYVNVRTAPSPMAETLRIAEKGEKLRVIGRQSNWVQISDPTTLRSGWVNSRFTATAPAH